MVCARLHKTFILLEITKKQIRVKRLLFIFGLVFSMLKVDAQKQIETREQTWFAYFNQTRITNRSGIWTDLHLRLTDDFVNEKSVSIARLGYTYFVSDNFRLTAGYAYATQYTPEGVPDLPEHRPWQQVMWLEKKNGFSILQYFRVEERFRSTLVNNELSDGYSFNWRFRYSFAMTIPLKGKEVLPKTPFLFWNDELHVNAGKNIVNNYFDQNRLFAGVGYQFTRSLNAQVGYLYVFQQLPTPNQFVHINAVRLFIFHNLDLRKD
jgi:long-subunit fatty acid transport protein